VPIFGYGIAKINTPKSLEAGYVQSAVSAVVKTQYPNFNINKHEINEIPAFLIWIKEQLEFIISIEPENLNTKGTHLNNFIN
jgi:hypothetical protein